MINRRDIAIAIILTIITCGIYSIYWFIVLTDDAKKAANDDNFPSGGVAFLLTLVTCGIYSFYWAYKMGEIIKNAQEKNNIDANNNSVSYLILQLFGLSIINYALMQNDLNKIADAEA